MGFLDLLVLEKLWTVLQFYIGCYLSVKISFVCFVHIGQLLEICFFVSEKKNKKNFSEFLWDLTIEIKLFNELCMSFWAIIFNFVSLFIQTQQSEKNNSNIFQIIFCVKFSYHFQRTNISFFITCLLGAHFKLKFTVFEHGSSGKCWFFRF